jgi:hypothetical protein
MQAVEAVLNDYDWVFWLDADAWITNYDIKLETILPRQGSADFVVTQDINGPNAGSWLLRNSDWSRKFLKDWWSLHTTFSRVCRFNGCPERVPSFVHGFPVYNFGIEDRHGLLLTRQSFRFPFMA